MSSTPLPPSPSPPPTPSPTPPIGSPSSPSLSVTPTDDTSSTVSSPTVTPTVTPSVPTYPSSTTPTSSTPTSTPTPTSTSPTASTRPPITTASQSPTFSSTLTEPIVTTNTVYSSLLTESSTRVYETSSTITSDGQVYTTQVQVTTILNPGTVVNSSTTTSSSSSSNNTGAIVGGVIGGTAVLVLLGLLAYFLFNKRRRLKDEFDGNFDPLAVAHSKHSPHPSLGGGGGAAAAAAITTNPAGRTGNGTLPHNPDEDDGMGGRIARGADGGGVISPYPFASPPNQPLPASHHPQMTQYGQSGGGLPPGAMMALGAGAGLTAAAYSNENPQHHGHHRNPSNISSVSSGNYPASNGPPVGAYLGAYNSHPGGGGPGYQGQPGQSGQYLAQPYAQGQGQGQGQNQPSLSPTNTASSGGGLAYANYNNNYAPPIGRGPSPGPSVGRSDTVSQSQYTSSSGAGVGGHGGGVGLVGRTAKEIEAFGGNSTSLAAIGGGMLMSMPNPHVANPDDGPDGPRMPEPQAHQGPGYFGAQPTTRAQSYYNPSAGSTISGGPVVTPPGAASTTVQHSATSKPGLITLAPPNTSPPLVQHQDAGRVEENPEAPSEIPPAYDSLPDQIRR